MKIGFIGQGWIGKNYADSFEDRGFGVVRHANEAPYENNKDEIAKCDIVFIAVPTPSTPKGFDDSILRSVVPLVGKGKIAIIKSTLLPGTTESIQKENPDIFVLHSPEFLREVTARQDTDNPNRNIIGIPVDNEEYRKKAEEVLKILPKAPYELICKAREAELVKYGGNCFLYSKIVFMNMLYDLSVTLGADWEVVRDAMIADPRIGGSHMNPVHESGRGAGGHCFIKDFAGLRELYAGKNPNDKLGISLLEALISKNNELLRTSGKDTDLLEGVYGKIN